MQSCASVAPEDGAPVIPGTATADGHLSRHLTPLSVDHRSFPLTLDRTVTADGAAGTYATPRCHFRFGPPRVAIRLLDGALA
ncbi:MAG: hypothetical protein ACHQIO_10185 [Nevskiales bacterium]